MKKKKDKKTISNQCYHIWSQAERGDKKSKKKKGKYKSDQLLRTHENKNKQQQKTKQKKTSTKVISFGTKYLFIHKHKFENHIYTWAIQANKAENQHIIVAASS